jgi:hypothetical protein
MIRFWVGCYLRTIMLPMVGLRRSLTGKDMPEITRWSTRIRMGSLHSYLAWPPGNLLEWPPEWLWVE